MLAVIYFIVLKVLKVGVVREAAACIPIVMDYKVSMYVLLYFCLFVFFFPLSEINSFVRNSSLFLIRHLHWMKKQWAVYLKPPSSHPPNQAQRCLTYFFSFHIKFQPLGLVSLYRSNHTVKGHSWAWVQLLGHPQRYETHWAGNGDALLVLVNHVCTPHCQCLWLSASPLGGIGGEHLDMESSLANLCFVKFASWIS